MFHMITQNKMTQQNLVSLSSRNVHKVKISVWKGDIYIWKDSDASTKQTRGKQ